MSALFRVLLAVGLSTAIASNCLADEPTSSGTGFAVTADGWLLTNAHVVKDCQRIEIKGKGDASDPRIDAINDLALVKIAAPEPLKTLSFRKAPTRLGEDIVAIGFPLPTLLANTVKVTTGNVNALAGIRNDTRYIQISTPIQPGNSGGPVVDRDGFLLGITSATLSKEFADANDITTQNVNFAIRASVAELFMQSQSIADQSGDKAADQQPISTADLADKITPSVFQIRCYVKPEMQPSTTSIQGANAIMVPPSPSVQQPASVEAKQEPSLDVPQARSGIARHPKGAAPIKAGPYADSKTTGQALNGSPVQVLETDGNWYRVSTGASIGFMHYSWVRVNQFEEPPGDGRFVQVRSFGTLAEAQAFVTQSSIPLAAHLAANGWIAVTLHDIYGQREAKDLSNALKAHGLIAKDAMVTLGNTYVRKVCCD
ncbi:hypothetical protein FHT86_006954 [Rhizobium sp. BK313]|uniref:trypsin-like peptidase domain-containing protein n=1 Tax=Rhizobium sp. BK313 TaxID=2587081 RepID=UPI00105CB2C6|nr:trypsin-like peptidase domain-containing protein [Rhizobium sp. BK313]MBB3458628.1 hypothetical protein [Rhizobium sp. BK313]